MPRVNLEARFFASGRLAKFQELMGWGKAQAIGTLALLWHDSQAEERLGGTAEEVADWAWVREDIPRFVSALVACKFARADESGGLHICGNEDQLAWLVTQRERASLGGRTKANNMLAKQQLANCLADAKQNLAKPSPIQYNTGPKQRRPADSGSGEPAPSALNLITDEPSGSDVWSAYRAAYFAIYRVEPVRNAKMNALCKQLVKRLGGDGAIGVVKFFLTHRNSFYVAKAHDLGLCVADAEALHTQMIAGHQITTSEAQSVDSSSANRQAFENVRRKLEAEQNGGS